MTKAIPVTKEHLDTLRSVSARLMMLSNVLAQKEDNRISLDVHWSSCPNGIGIKLYVWNEKGIESSESCDWDYGNSNSDEQKEALLCKLTEWEEKYGLL